MTLVTTNPFAPQGSNAATTEPTSTGDQRYTTNTWVKNCTNPETPDGTVLEERFWNRIIGNLWAVLVHSSITTWDTASHDNLYNAIMALITDKVSEISHTDVLGVGPGLYLTQPDKHVADALGKLGTIVASSIAPAQDLLKLLDTSGGQFRQATPYALVSSVLEVDGNIGISYNSSNGKITLTFVAPDTIPSDAVIQVSGLATGGGQVANNPTIDVPAATSEETIAGSIGTKAVTPIGLAAALAEHVTGDLGTLGTRVSSVEARLDTDEASIASLGTRVTSLEGRASTLEADVVAIDDDISALALRVTTLEAATPAHLNQGVFPVLT